MYVEKNESMMTDTLKNLCCSNGWCYGVFWGFDQNSLVLTIKDAYFEEQMGVLIHSMLLQAHVMGGGLIGQTAFTKAHQWMHSDAYNHDQTQCSLGSFLGLEALQDDSEFYCQFSAGIKTIALISVEPWGVVQLGSTQKIPERKEFVDRVKLRFRGMNKYGNEFFDSYKGFTSLLSNTSVPDSMYRINSKHVRGSECFANRGLLAASDSVPSTSDRNSCFQQTDQRVHSPFQSGNNDFAYACRSTSGAVESRQDEFNTQDVTSLLDQRQSGLLTLEEVFSLDSNSAEVVSKHARSDELSQWFSSQPGSSSSCARTDSTLEHPSSSSSSPKRIRMTDNLSWRHFDAKMQHGMRNMEINHEASRKIPVSCVVNISSAYAGDASSTRRQKEPPKARKKKYNPGTKPRPKDRQMIQDRLAELRNLIPNGDKMSIDRLLERTARHLNFMQSLTKHTEILKQIDKSAGIPTEPANNACGGVTWACEVSGDQTMVCPLKVKDLSTPGQMLIEILCEEQGLLSQAVDVLGGLGLVILKGLMKIREANKMCAQFLVEAAEMIVTWNEFSQMLHETARYNRSTPWTRSVPSTHGVPESELHVIYFFLIRCSDRGTGISLCILPSVRYKGFIVCEPSE